MNTYAGALLITNQNTLLLQQRDYNPGTINPGLISTFGGAANKDETPIQCVIREIKEETNLEPKEEDFTFFNTFTKTEDDGSKLKLYIYILKNISKDTLEIYEGKGYFELHKEDNLDDIKITPTAKKIIQDYFKKY